jgi:hypothetical protein
MRALGATMLVGLPLLAAGCGAATMDGTATTPQPGREQPAVVVDDEALARIERELVATHGADQAERVHRGLAQVRERWRPDDGDATAFEEFVEANFLVDPAALDETAQHLEYALEMIDGHTLEIEREVSRYQELEIGPIRPVDELLATYSPSSHLTEDLFTTRVAFAALLNFPVTTLEQRLAEGPGWSREQWALARLTDRFEYRVPAEVRQEIERVSAAADRYIDSYNIRMDRLAPGGQSAGFRDDLSLISHWGLRDELRSLYAQPDGLARQRTIARVMERIIAQEIPADVIDSDALEWDPVSNRVRKAGAAAEAWHEAAREPDARYAILLDVFRAHAKADPYFPSLPTHIDRSFSLEREIPEPRMRELLESVLLSETAARVGREIQKRLGRPLEPFDLWYDGFRPGSAVDSAVLDRVTRERYPNAEAFQRDVPRILNQLGFTAEKAQFLADHIVVDPARGAGHAIGAQRRDDRAHLRTRIGPEGMEYQGFNIAAHELGHNVEQVFSMSTIDHTLLEGVPNTGFTEAFAFLFQARDLELLGHQPPADAEAQRMRALDRFWTTFEISGVAILDMEIWHWMYAHPEATPAELREAVLAMARDVWNRYYAPVYGVRDSTLLAIYSHIIAYGLYTPDYPLGFLITAQVEDYVRERNLAAEMERMCRLGQLAPDVWMQQAVGGPISSAAVVNAAEAALAAGPAPAAAP